MAKINDIRHLAEETARDISGSPRDWMRYLDTASRLYRYPFSDTLLIHAQRPEATACASLELWNRKMSRWVNRGAKGIALIDETGPRMRLRYVFDVADTHPVRGGRMPYLWQLKEHQMDGLLDHLVDTYGLPAEETDLGTALFTVAELMAGDNLDESMDGLLEDMEGTLLEGLDADSVRVEFGTLLTVSVCYTLLQRCGLEPMDYLEEMDFREIADFRSLSVLAYLGNATNRTVEPILRDIGRTVHRMDLEEIHEKQQEELAKGEEKGYNEFNALKREIESPEGGIEHGDYVPEVGGLSVPEPDAAGGSTGDREIRDAEEELSEGEQAEPVSEHAADREAEPASAGDGGSGAGADGSPDERAAWEVSGTGQGSRPDGMGSTHEQPDGDGGGEHLSGIGLHLTGETTEQDLSEAEEKIASALSLPDLPTASAQIRKIEERMAALYAGEITIPSEVVDEVLRSGGNREGSQLRLIYNFMIDQTPEEYTDFVRREYGTGGIGLEIGGKEYSVWYDELGMQIAVGHTVNDKLLDKAFLSWEDVSGRIHQLLRQGEYAPQVVLDAARENALTEHATVLSFMERDMEEGVAELVFADTKPFRGVYPDIVENISALIAQPDYLADLNERLAGLADAYAEDRNVMRSHHYRPDKVLAQFQKFAKEAVPYQARDGFAWVEHPVFITEDEIDAFLAGGGPYSDGRLSTYAFFIQEKSDKEKADFIKKQYGIGGRSHALSGADDSHADYNGKGLKLVRGGYVDSKAELLLKWPKVAKRIDHLIENDKFLKAADYSRMPGYEREQMAGRIIGFYSRMPEEIERPYEDDFFHENARKVLPSLLEEPETAEKLAADMDAALAALPLDFPDYDARAETLLIIHQYVEGTYTIFPERKKDAEVEGIASQLSLSDFMDMGKQGKEPVQMKAPGKKLRERKIEEPAKGEPGSASAPEVSVVSSTVFSGEKNHLPYDVVVEKLHFEEPEKEVPKETPQTEEKAETELLINTILEIDGREFRIDSVDYANGKVSLQDMTMLKEARYPIFRVEPIEVVRIWLEESREHPEEMQEQAEGQAEAGPVETAMEETESEEEQREEADQRLEQEISETMGRADVYFEDFSPEQMDVVYEAAEHGLDVTPVLNPEYPPEQMQLIADVLKQRAADDRMAFTIDIAPLTSHVMSLQEVNAVRRERNLPLEAAEGLEHQEPGIQIGRQDIQEPEIQVETLPEQLYNFRITDMDLGAGGPKQKFRANMDAIYLLKKLENEGRLATPEEQEVLSRFVGWGGIPQAFDGNNREWAKEYAEAKAALLPEEYRAARGSTLNAFYTSPTVISAMYEVLGEMDLSSGNVLEPSCGVGNFMGLLPEEMSDVMMYGVELDGISGRIARQLYQKNQIAVQGFETAEFPDSFFDCVIGNVPFGQYKVNDRKYDRHNFLIHDYFIAKSLDLVRPGGVVAVVTSSGTMDKQNPSARKYFAGRADLLGAVRLPNNAFMRNANTGVVADILFFQKRDRVALELPQWVELGMTPEGYSINSYFAEHPEMVLGEITTESTQYGKQETTVKPTPGADLAVQLKEAMRHIKGTITELELEDSDLSGEEVSIPADPSVKNFSFANVDGQVYYRENSRMNKVELPATTAERVLGMIALRDTTRDLLQCQMEDGSDAEVAALQQRLSGQYDRFTARYGLISSTANRRAFSQDNSYCLLCSLEILNEEGNLQRKADIFTKRTIRKAEPVTSVDTASEALAVSIGEKARVDVPFMAQLTGKSEDEITEELHGVIFKNPLTDRWETSDEYLSGDVREKLRIAKDFAENHPEYEVNVQGLERVQPKDLEASEIEVRLGATWIDSKYINQFIAEVFQTPSYRLGKEIAVKYAKINGLWNVSAKNADTGNALVYSTYGTSRANAYRLLEDALNLRDTKIYDRVEEDGKEKRVLNKKETMLAQQKQEMIRDAFKEWIFRDIDRREDLCRIYNELFNSIRPREYDGSHIRFVGMTPEITLMQHQKNAVAHILYGHNTLLAHCVGAGKTFQMVAAAMESKRLGLCQKSLFVVPNHLTEQWGSDFLRLYPGANVLVSTKKDFEPANRKKFCSRIATGNYDAIIIGHSQFERIPLSRERQIANIERQIDDITLAIEEASEEEGTRYTVKQMEKTRKSLEARLERLNDQTRKDDVVTFEQLGVDRLFVDESHFYKNLFLYTKMRNVAGISQTDAQKSSDMFMKCQYLDEITGGRGVTFAKGTPVSNSMVELYTIMRYLQYDTIQRMGLGHFDSWAATFGETVTAIELSPEGTGYRAKTRFARFFNLPELLSLFKESADVQTADMLNLPVPDAEYINEVLKPSEEQRELVSSFAERAEIVRNGGVDPSADNMLKITNDGRKCALDQRLINDMLPDAPESKVNRCVKNVFDIWKETEAKRSTQLVFCDLSTPKNDGTFNVYDDVREKLVERGVPREEIAFIHEANTETRKAELFAKVRAGQVRVLLGSTPKLGAGTNIQDRLIALHHLDCPWKPSDLEQQEGRILRQGNQNEKVRIYRYVTENTFDAYMWQILENKQKFISQIMTSKSPVRACEDVDDTALSYAEIKALATGNPYIKEKMDLDIQVSKLKLMKANHTSQKYKLETDIARNYPAQIAATRERIEGLRSDAAEAKLFLEREKGKDKFAMTIAGKTYTERKEAGMALLAACGGLKEAKISGKVGEYAGFTMAADFDYWIQKHVLTLKRQCSYKIEIGKDALGNLQRIHNALVGIEKKLGDSERKLETLQQQLATAKEEVEKPFAKEQELAEKLERLAELNSLLNMDEKGPSDALGMDEGVLEVADSPRGAVTMAEKVREMARAADDPGRASILNKLHRAQKQVAGVHRQGATEKCVLQL